MKNDMIYQVIDVVAEIYPVSLTASDASVPPNKPETKKLDVNITGVLYTTKLALHYFRRQPVCSERDRCLILVGSLAGYIDQPGSALYCMSKFAVRALMRTLRRAPWTESIRVNMVTPSYANF